MAFGKRTECSGYTFVVPSPAEGPFRATHEERRAMLGSHMLAVIEPMLAQTSYDELSVERIIRAGKVGRTTFYAYFGDKNALLMAMTQQVLVEMGDIAFWRLPSTATKAALRDALEKIIGAYARHRHLFRTVVDCAGFDAGVRTVYESVVDSGVANVARHIAEGQASGTAAPELDPDGTARLLVLMAERALYEFLRDGDDKSTEALVGPLTDVFWRVLYAGYH